MKMKLYSILYPFLIGLCNAGCPHEDPGLQKWSTYNWIHQPVDGTDLVITDKILLDIETPRLGKIVIQSGGSLVWSPHHKVSLKARAIKLGSEGSLDIGSADCPYEEDTSITLLGTESDIDPNDSFGTKYIGVEEGGSLEIHGQQGRRPWTKLAKTFHKNPNSLFHTIELIDPVISWKIGDKVVISSTDFDHAQAEIFEIAGVRGSSVDVKGESKFTHFGEIWEGIDMRAEVALLSRNIKISGEIEEGKTPCVGDYWTECQENEDMDTFGGHTKALKGFKSYNIRGAELFYMGASEFIGNYPIHFHMAEDTTRDGVPMIMSDNSIHDTFSRCITIHGSHKVELRNNVAYNHIGHCYFLEDGGERDTVMVGNIGLGTKRGRQTTTDHRPTTFWITSPLTTLVDNVAAGADTFKGVGFWLLYAREPIGPSKDKGFFQKNEARHTQLTLFKNNVAHSNGEFGFAMFMQLKEFNNQPKIVNYEGFNARLDPLDPDSPLVPMVVDKFIGYKNIHANIISRAVTTEIKDCRLADSLSGVFFTKSALGGYQRIINSVIAGETPNVGNDFEVKLDGESDFVTMDRSYPDKLNANRTFSGITLDAAGPTRIENIHFLNFKSSETRQGIGMKFRNIYRFQNGASTSAKGLYFNYEDPNEGLYIYNPEEQEDPGNHNNNESVAIRDVDGSLSKQPGVTMVKRDAFYISDMEGCVLRNDWNLEICPSRFANVYQFPPSGDYGMFLTYGSQNIQNIMYEDPSFTLPIPKDSTLQQANDVKIINYADNVGANTLIFRVAGLDKDDSLTFGICLPMDLANLVETGQKSISSLFYSNQNLETASSLNNLLNDSDGETNYFYDFATGVFYIRLAEESLRNPGELGDCIGHQDQLDDCPFLKVIVNNVDKSDFNCLERF